MITQRKEFRPKLALDLMGIEEVREPGRVQSITLKISRLKKKFSLSEG